MHPRKMNSVFRPSALRTLCALLPLLALLACGARVPTGESGCHTSEDCLEVHQGASCFRPGSPNCGICYLSEGDMCRQDTECGAGKVCDSTPDTSGCGFCNGPPRYCMAACQSNKDCPASRAWCDQGHCGSWCLQDTDCPAMHICTGSPNEHGLKYCNRKTCKGDGDCNDGYCVQGLCETVLGSCQFNAP